MDHKKRMDEFTEYYNYYVNRLVFTYRPHYRFITDIEIPFPKNIFIVNHDNEIEVSNIRWNNHLMKGWGTKGPYKILGKGVELWLTYRTLPILSFEEWLLKIKLKSNKYDMYTSQ